MTGKESMSAEERYVVMGRPESGYSMKVRSGLRYKGLEYEWIDRCLKNEKRFQAHARVQLIPLVFLPDGTVLQDSTPILERLEADHPEPSFHPPDPATRFLSELIEEYGDEWGNKLMFHHRWGFPADQRVRGQSLARGMLEGHPLRIFAPVVAPFVVRRMIPRMAFAGANSNNAPLLEESWHSLLALLQAHLRERPYLFGGRPAFGDFGLWGQLHQAYTDPTCGAALESEAPAVVAWIERMLEPRCEGDFESLAVLEETLRPLLQREVAPRFLAWGVANEAALAEGQAQTELQMDGRLYYQRTFKYPASTLAILRRKFERVGEAPELRRLLQETGCLSALEGGLG